MVHDDQLRLMFTCWHPALDPAAQVALTLRLLGGLTTAEIAAGFLVEEAAMAKRLTRTKQKIAATLMLLTEARRDARVVDCTLVTLDKQDRMRYDGSLVAEGHALVRACLRRGLSGRYQLLAAVGAVHTDAASAAKTDWR